MKVLDSIATVGRVRDREQTGVSWERLQNIGLATLCVVAAIAVVFALRGPEPAPAPGPTPIASEPTPTPSDEPSDSASPEPSTPAAADLTSVLVDQEGETIARTPVVECEVGLEPVVVQVSSAGEPWQTRPIPDLVTVTGLHVQGDGYVRVVGHDAACGSASFVSRDLGATWSPAANEVRFWSILPDNDDQVATPTGAVEVPCVPRAVSAINGTIARLWCETGQIVGTADGGAHWVALGSLPDAESIAYLDAADGVALRLEPDCPGVSVLVTRDGGSDWETVHCAEIAGPWGVLADPTTITVVGGDASETSDDVGETWAAG